MEVFLIAVSSAYALLGLLHVRGGVSSSSILRWPPFFVFSTSVEVFPKALGFTFDRYGSSPRPWRCFHHWYRAWRLVRVFSTSVEVFLNGKSGMAKTYSLLHVRGGVSYILAQGGIAG